MNRISAATIGFPFLFMLMATSTLGISGRVVMGILLFIATVILLIISNIRKLSLIAPTCAILSACVACFMFAICEYNTVEDYRENVAYPTHLEGTVIDEPRYNGRYQYVIDSDDGRRVLLISDELDNGELYSRFDGEVIMYLYDSTYDGARFRAYVEEPELCSFTDGGSGVQSVFSAIRGWASARFSDIADGKALEFLNGIMLGDESAISEELYGDFRITGLAHILVISGSHLSTVMTVITVLFSTMRTKRRCYGVLALIVMLFYMALVGFSASVVRSGICCFAVGLGYVLIRDSNPVASLGVAALLTGIIDPYTAVSIGFGLSFFSTFGIVTVGMYLTRKINEYRIPRIIRSVFKLVIITATAQVFTLPVLVSVYEDFSLVSVLSNVLVNFAVDAAVTLALIYLMLSALYLVPIAFPFGMISSLFVKYCIWIVELLAELPYASVEVPRLAFVITILIIFSAISVLMIFGRRYIPAIAVLVTLSVAFAAASTVYYGGAVHITVVSSESCIIRRGDDAVIVGCGERYYDAKRMAYYASKLGKTDIRLIIGDEDTDKTLLTVLDSVDAYAVMANITDKLIKRCDDEIIMFERGGTLTPFDGCTVTDYGEYILVSVDNINIVVTNKFCTVPSEVRADVMICADDVSGTSRTAIIANDANPLALSAEKVYNANSDSFTLTLSRRGRIISAR